MTGVLSQTANSSYDLKTLLAARGLQYNLSFKLANGFPGILTVGNAVPSRCQVVFTLSQILPFVTEEPFPGLDIKIPLNRALWGLWKRWSRA